MKNDNQDGIDRRLLIVSNRLPISVQKRKGKLYFESSAGGLATGLASFYKSHRSIWIGWPGIELERLTHEERESTEATLSDESCHSVFLSQHDIDGFYHGFCNRTIWPLFHYFPTYAAYNKDTWRTYQSVNETFCNTVVKLASDDDIIWIHDYQLMLLPGLLRQELPTATIGYFLHIPFPSYEIYRLIPWRKEIIEGLLGADLLGFHTYDYVRHFMNTVRLLFNYETTQGQIDTRDRIVSVDTFPMGIDYKRFSDAISDPSVQTEIAKYRQDLGEGKIILSVDRLDYTKGIPQRLEAFGAFLDRHQEYSEKLTFILVVVPSRTKVRHYEMLKARIDELVGEINGRYGTISWMPIRYLYRFLTFPSLVALYHLSDVALITPLRDGMNLIAKEYVASKTDKKGVLILSDTAGAAKELGQAIITNVNNQEEIIHALETALTLPCKEQIESIQIMQTRLERYDVARWAKDFVDSLLNMKKLQKDMEVRALNRDIRERLLTDFQQGDRRLIILDYDGTLIPFSDRPQDAKPTAPVLDVLRKLANDNKTELVLISGRDRYTLDTWFKGINMALVAEHGAWIRDVGQEWQVVHTMTSEWKPEVYDIMELWTDKTPGSSVEEKEFSLVWHYRRADNNLGEIRARGLANDLYGLTSSLNLQLLRGNKVLEVRNTGIDKGQATMRWLSGREWDFILAIGDDLTDEDTFKVLPPSAWSIKVGFSASAAKWNLLSPNEVVVLLHDLTVQSKPITAKTSLYTLPLSP
ncbi:MAG: bifunctional alpha,alpha-trehalose-phosphate synthase (UDP-forming)/trehalose-phosphatase [Chloroflexota bacterium]|nr:bifunctional alpha,alpha-trehalose-phosphate synthase (UDP-forming)/trehalose-phosphatase [Chloroflexota bacterium]